MVNMITALCGYFSGTFVSDTGGTFKSDTPGTFVSDIGGTFEVILSADLGKRSKTRLDHPSRYLTRDVFQFLVFGVSRCL